MWVTTSKTFYSGIVANGTQSIIVQRMSTAYLPFVVWKKSESSRTCNNRYIKPHLCWWINSPSTFIVNSGKGGIRSLAPLNGIPEDLTFCLYYQMELITRKEATQNTFSYFQSSQPEKEDTMKISEATKRSSRTMSWFWQKSPIKATK